MSDLIAAQFAARQIATEREILLAETARLHELAGDLHAAAQRGRDITGDAAALHQRIAGIVERSARLKGITETVSYLAPEA